MAYISTERVNEMRSEIKKLFPSKDGWKLSIRRRHYSTIVVDILSAPIDLITDYRNCLLKDKYNDNERLEVLTRKITNFSINQYFMKDFLYANIYDKIFSVLYKGHYDRSDIQTDYFDVSWYVDLNVGSWDKDFQFIENNKYNYEETKIINIGFEDNENSQPSRINK